MNNIDLKEKTAVITGGAQGIGYAVAERILQSGVHLTYVTVRCSALPNSVLA